MIIIIDLLFQSLVFSLKGLSFGFFFVFQISFWKIYSTLKIMNICCLNVGSKVRLYLGPAYNTPTATSNLKTLHRKSIFPTEAKGSKNAVGGE